MNQSTIKYEELNGTSYHAETSETMRQLLERIRANQTRCRFYWGNQETGEDWGDVYGVSGTIGRSMGPCKVPLLIHSTRSMGGGAMLDHCIVRIGHANKRHGGDLYRHPSYHTKEAT